MTPPGTNRTVVKTLTVLDCFSRADSRLALGDLARKTGLPKATAHRAVASLVAARLMRQTADGSYGLGVRLIELGALAREGLDVAEVCAPAMRALAEATKETVLLTMADWPASEMVMIGRLDSTHALSILSPVGRRSKIGSGVFGKALLLGLDPVLEPEFLERLELVAFTSSTLTDKPALQEEISQSRARGYAVEKGEYLEGVSGVAAPVLFDGPRPLAALGVVGPSTRMLGHLDRCGQMVVRHTAALRHTPPEPAVARSVHATL